MTGFDAVAHTAAVISILQGLNLPGGVFNGEVPTTVPHEVAGGRGRGHAVVYGSPGVRQRTTLTAVSGVTVWGFQVTAVGGDQPGCLWVADVVTAALVDAHLSVTNWASTPIVQLPGPGVSRDDTNVVLPRFYTPLMFQLTAVPTT